MYENGLIKELRLISNFFTSQAGLQLITIHVLPNISESKYNETIKFCHIMEYNVRNGDGVVLEIYLDHKFQWPQEGLNCQSLAYEEVI